MPKNGLKVNSKTFIYHSYVHINTLVNFRYTNKPLYLNSTFDWTSRLYNTYILSLFRYLLYHQGFHLFKIITQVHNIYMISTTIVSKIVSHLLYPSPTSCERCSNYNITKSNKQTLIHAYKKTWQHSITQSLVRQSFHHNTKINPNPSL